MNSLYIVIRYLMGEFKKINKKLNLILSELEDLQKISQLTAELKSSTDDLQAAIEKEKGK